MKTTLGLKNFRIFDDKGVDVHINPLTVLTGCNSSGKSSIVKALILLNEFLQGVRNSASDVEPRLQFDRKPLSLLGDFESIVNKDAQDKCITLSYTVDSLYLGSGTIVELTFGLQDNDIRKDGFLKEVAIKDADGNLLYCGSGYKGIKRFFPDSNKPKPISDFGETPQPAKASINKVQYFTFHLVCQALDGFNRAYADHEVTGNTTAAEVEDVHKNVIDFLGELKKYTSKDMILLAIDFYSKKHGSSDFRELFKTDGDYLQRGLQAGIITYLPILDLLDSFSKEEFKDKFGSMCIVDGLKPDGKAYLYRKGLVDSIIHDFIEGDFPVFSDYYRSIEDAFLNEGGSLVQSCGTNAQLAIPDLEAYFQCERVEGDVIFEETEGNFISKPLSPNKKEDELFDFRGNVALDQVFYLLTSIKDRPMDDDYIVCFNDDFTGVESRDHRILRDYLSFRRSALRDVFTIDICDSLRYVGSNRIEIKRLYTLENQDNFGRTVSEYFEAQRLKKRNAAHKPGDFINKWIQSFGIGQRFSIESLPGGIGLVLKIYQSEEDTEGRILADYGYGISQLVSILLEIETAVLKAETVYDVNVVDYEKQSANLFKIFSAWEERHVPICIAIEEPEIHLHPRYQSLLADMFVDAYLNYDIHFIVETHSEYLIRKLQNHIGKGTIKPDALSFLYVEDGNGSERKVRDIGIAQDGRLTDKFGSGFFDEADSLAMNLLKIKGGLL